MAVLGEQADPRPLSVAEVYRLHAQTVARWAARLAGPTAEIEDLVQEVFIAVHRQLPGFRGDSALTTWLYGITANKVRDWRRRERVRRWFDRSEDARTRAGTAPVAQPLEQLLEAQTHAKVYRALDQLSERYRSVLILHEMEGLGGKEIAELLGAKVATVWVWLHRARGAFAQQLAKLEHQEGRR